MRTSIIVLSMHRSGSSALTRTISLLGYDLPQHLVPAIRGDNDLGFWESQNIVDFNNDFLSRIGSHWYDFAPIAFDALPESLMEESVPRATEAVDEEYGDAPLFVMKDPRMSRLMPLWSRVLSAMDVRTQFVLPIRNPFEVAQSLHNRNRIIPDEAVLSWLRHTLDAERQSRNLPRAFLHYNDLLLNWRGVTNRIASKLALRWPNQSSEAENKIDAFVSDSWRHQTVADERVFDDPMLSDWVKDAYRIFDRWCRDEVHDDDHAALDEITVEFDRSVPAYRGLAASARTTVQRARKLEGENLKIEAELLKLRSERDRSTDNHTAIEAARRLEEENANLQTKIEKLHAAREKELSDQARRVTELASSQEALRRENSQLKQFRVETQGAYENTVLEYNSRVEMLLAEIKSLIVSVEQSEGEISKVRQKSDQQTEQLAEHVSEQDILKQENCELRESQVEMRVILDKIVSEYNSRIALILKKSKNNTAALKNSQQKLKKNQTRLKSVANKISKIKLDIGGLIDFVYTSHDDFSKEGGSGKNTKSILDRIEMEVFKRVFHMGMDYASIKYIRENANSNRWTPKNARSLSQEKLKRIVQETGHLNEEWYLKRYPDVAEANMSALDHYIKYGLPEGRYPNPVVERVES